MIELRNLSKTYSSSSQEVNALNNISLTINDGDIYGIIGMSGAGKSTLVRCINMLERPTSGQILLDGEDITEKSITDRARMGIGFAFQQPVRFKGIQVLDLIRLATGRPISAASACKYLAAVGLCVVFDEFQRVTTTEVTNAVGICTAAI